MEIRLPDVLEDLEVLTPLGSVYVYIYIYYLKENKKIYECKEDQIER